MNDEWPIQVIEDLEQFKAWLLDSDDDLIYRGQLCCHTDLKPSLDRYLPSASSYQTWLQKESCLLDEFRKGAERFLGSPERQLLHHPKNSPTVAALMVMQHYGAPTRLLDWTYSRAVAAYFACIKPCAADGVVWWVSQSCIEESVHELWNDNDFARFPEECGGQINLDGSIFREHKNPLVSMVKLPIPFPRLAAQWGLFTIGSQLGLAHDRVLSQQLNSHGPRDFGRIVINTSIREAVIFLLHRLGVNAVTLQHMGADAVGRNVSERWRQPDSATSIEICRCGQR